MLYVVVIYEQSIIKCVVKTLVSLSFWFSIWNHCNGSKVWISNGIYIHVYTSIFVYIHMWSVNICKYDNIEIIQYDWSTPPPPPPTWSLYEKDSTNICNYFNIKMIQHSWPSSPVLPSSDYIETLQCANDSAWQISPLSLVNICKHLSIQMIQHGRSAPSLVTISKHKSI